MDVNKRYRIFFSFTLSLILSFMQIKDLYQLRVNNFSTYTEKLQKKENRLSVARLISFSAALALLFILYSLNIFLAVIIVITGLTVFGIMVKLYNQTEALKNTNQLLRDINQSELNSVNGDYSAYKDGTAYRDNNHPYSADLDLFGSSSLFQFINRTSSKPASDMLASWLLAPAAFNEIPKRQHAVEELKPMIEWRQELMVAGYKSKNAADDPVLLENWVQRSDFFSRVAYIKTVTLLLSTITLALLIIILVFSLPISILIFDLLLNFIFYFRNLKKINRLHQQVSRSSEMLNTYREIIQKIEQEEFRSEKLMLLQQIFNRGVKVSGQIEKLSKLVSRLDTRFNIMVAIPLNLFFFWDIHYCLALEKWKRNHTSAMSSWFSAMAEFEVLASFANMYFNNPAWTMAEIKQDYFTLVANKAGHPLIPAHRRISNNIRINGTGKVVLITGSNMSGKSTFLRTCGVNAVLALAGAPVCASSFSLSYVNILTSMRITDSLEDNTSSFYAELKRLAMIIDRAENDPHVFLLLDEILRGTNSKDRHTGSAALIRQLTAYGTVAVLATHDLSLADMAEQMPDKLENYHFDVKVDGEELYFDYLLTPGICSSLNASILMKKMGIRI